ncbi:hypothetical protein [Escherichia coli]|uniref:hypothetical protein n=1 Tax=Escherichia coli TaxID=562 RepID=UPI00207BEEC6|nr:hypothetical protein [Escherichia coli]
MSTITKEWLLQKIADMEAARDEIPFGLDDDDNNTLAALRIALASLEAEPVASCIVEDGGMCIDGFGEYVGHSLPDGPHQLYAAPPAPVSDSLLSDLLTIAKTAANAADECAHAEFGDDSMEHSAAIADWERRAAMLQGADVSLTNEGNITDNAEMITDKLAEDGNSPVIAKAYDIEAFGVFSATEGENGLMLQIERFRFGSEKCPQIGKENMVTKFALQAIINRLQEHCDSMLNEALVDILSMPAAPQQEVK